MRELDLGGRKAEDGMQRSVADWPAGLLQDKQCTPAVVPGRSPRQRRHEQEALTRVEGQPH